MKVTQHGGGEEALLTLSLVEAGDDDGGPAQLTQVEVRHWFSAAPVEARARHPVLTAAAPVV